MIEFTELEFILFVVMLGATVGLSILLTYFLAPITKRVDFMNKIRKSDKGIARVVEKGKTITSYIVDFDKPLAETRHKVFFMNPDLVYRDDGVKCINFNELDALDAKALVGKPIQRSKVKEALESVGLGGDEELVTSFKGLAKLGNDKKFYLFPVSFEMDKPKEAYKNPETVKNVLMQQKALAETKALMFDKILKYCLFASAGGAIMAFLIGYQIYDTLDKTVIPQVNRISGIESDISNINTQLAEIRARLYTNSGSTVLPNGTIITGG